MSRANRKMVKEFLVQLYDKKQVREAFERYVSADYIQHNPSAENGREAAISFFEGFLNTSAILMSVKRMIVEDDMVAVHMHLQLDSDSPGFAVIDVWRIDNGNIVEHWDVIQEVPKATVSGNSMF